MRNDVGARPFWVGVKTEATIPTLQSRLDCHPRRTMVFFMKDPDRLHQISERLAQIAQERLKLAREGKSLHRNAEAEEAELLAESKKLRGA